MRRSWKNVAPSLLLGVLLAYAMLPFFNQLSGKAIRLDLRERSWMVPALLGGSLLVGLLAGSYPAFYLSSFQPIQVLKGKIATGFKSGWLRNSLVVFQFATAITLIVGTLVIYSQLNYIRNKKLGYDREQLVTTQNIYSLGEHAKTFKQEVQSIPGVVAGILSGNLPNGGTGEQDGYFKSANFNNNDAVRCWAHQSEIWLACCRRILIPLRVCVQNEEA